MALCNFEMPNEFHCVSNHMQHCMAFIYVTLCSYKQDMWNDAKYLIEECKITLLPIV
jgi:hypothetical protein